MKIKKKRIIKKMMKANYESIKINRIEVKIFNNKESFYIEMI